MPTTRPRHVVTETDEVAAALDAAARRWPEDAGSRSRLLVRLVKQAHRQLADESQRAVEARRSALVANTGVLSGCFPDGYLAELRAEWPE
jgi:hypothetical protein